MRIIYIVERYPYGPSASPSTKLFIYKPEAYAFAWMMKRDHPLDVTRIITAHVDILTDEEIE